jgi:hypothetical protein
MCLFCFRSAQAGAAYRDVEMASADGNEVDTVVRSAIAS